MNINNIFPNLPSKKMPMKKTLVAATVALAAIGGTGAIINQQNQKKAEKAEEAEAMKYEQKVDSILITREMDANDTYNRSLIQTMLEIETLKQIEYKNDCQRYNLNPDLERTKDDLREIKTLRAKEDSIRRENVHESFSASFNNLYNKIIE